MSNCQITLVTSTILAVQFFLTRLLPFSMRGTNPIAIEDLTKNPVTFQRI